MSRRRTHRRSRTAAVLAFALLVLTGCGSIYDVPLPGGADTGDNPLKIRVIFRDVLDLVPQSTVKVNDITVGKVTGIELKGYVADVSLELRRSTKLPDNAVAELRQTSLLGEKFVSLSAPGKGPSDNKLSNGDVIPLSRSGRNPEVEEVFSALALLLNGGGVGQLKIVTEELNKAIGGRETEVRSVLRQIRSFVGQLDQNKGQIIRAIENLNRLSLQLRRQDSTIKSTLDNLPASLASVNSQREDLVRVLRALSRLSDVGVRVIRDSKQSTINSLRDLAPVLNGFAKAGQDLPKALQVFLTYPFVDESVGRNPQVARNLHLGDYVNLSARLDLDLGSLTLPELPLPTITVPGPISQVCKQARAAAIKAANQSVDALPGLSEAQKKQLKATLRDDINALPCNQVSGADLNKLIERLLESALSDLPALARKICTSKTAPGQLCKALGLGGGGGGGPVPSVPAVPGVPVPTPKLPGVGGAVGGVAGLGRTVPGGVTVSEPLDPFGLEKLGLDAGLGSMLYWGVAS